MFTNTVVNIMELTNMNTTYRTSYQYCQIWPKVHWAVYRSSKNCCWQ